MATKADLLYLTGIIRRDIQTRRDNCYWRHCWCTCRCSGTEMSNNLLSSLLQ